MLRHRRFDVDEYAGGHPDPADTLLVIEVADSSIHVDRALKLGLYAEVGIPEVWIADLTKDTLEIHRQPKGSAYEARARLSTGSVAPLAFPDLEIAIGEIWPARG